MRVINSNQLLWDNILWVVSDLQMAVSNIYLHQKQKYLEADYSVWHILNMSFEYFKFKYTLKSFNQFFYNNIFWHVNVYIFWKFVEYTLHWDKKQISKNISLGQNTLFFFRVIQLTRVYTFNLRDSYMSWNTRFVTVKLFVRFPFSIPFRFY